MLSRSMAASAAAAVLMAGGVPPARAVVINVNYLNSYDFGGGLGEQVTLVRRNVDQAVAFWRMVLPTNVYTTTIDIRLANLGGDNQAGLTTYLTKDVNGRVSSSRIDFNSNTQKWYFDATPADASEYELAETRLNRNNATADTALFGCQGPARQPALADKWDFLSVAIHEIGHALGIGFNGTDPANYTRYADAITAAGGGKFNIPAAYGGLYPNGTLPFLDVPIIGSHYDGTVRGGDYNLTTMADPGWGRGTRAFMTDPDILGIGAVAGLARADLALVHIPAPSALFALGVLALGRRRRSP